MSQKRNNSCIQHYPFISTVWIPAFVLLIILAGLCLPTQTMAKELAPYGIQVNAVAPGFIGTDMIKSIPGDLAEKYLEAVPMKRFGSAEDVANCVASLVSDAFSYMTGQVIVLDGGLSL